MIFENLDIKHLEKFKSIVMQCTFLTQFGSEYCFTVMFALRKFQNFKCACVGDSMIICGENEGKKFFSPPVCKDGKSFIECVDIIADYCKQNAVEFSILCLTHEMYELLKDNTKYKFTLERDLFEYIYLPSDLINFPGKKFHSKRNFVNSFNSSYSYIFRKYQQSDLKELEVLISNWEDTKYSYSAYEKEAIINTLKHRDKLSVVCDVLFIEGAMAGFIIASVDKKLDVNIIFEKADIKYKGIYTVILNKFISGNFSTYRYINMQEDMGIEGLKKSKLSYQPVKLLEKYNMSLNDE